MKERKLLDAIGMADEEYVQEAAPKDRQRIRHPFYLAAAACLVLALTVGLGVLVWQNTGIRKYKDSEYYGVIKVLGEYYDYLDSLPARDDDEKSENSAGLEGPKQQYVEVTDNQEEAVIEGDLLKRSDRYAYYVLTQYASGTTIVKVNVYSIDGAFGEWVTSIEIAIEERRSVYESYIYLSSDCKTLAVVYDGYDDSKEGFFYTQVYTYDVSDVANITQKGKWFTKGNLTETRLVGNELIVATTFYARKNANFSDLSQYIPGCTTEKGTEFVAPEDVYYPDSVRSSTYRVFWNIDIDSLTVNDSAAMLSYSDEMYFTDDTVYLQCVQSQKTLISGLRYRGDGEMTLLGTAEVKGRILNQYSMDEHEGILRLVTGEGLYCISLDDWTIKASVLGFVPEGEAVQSVRFDGDYAYVCTAIIEELVILDPVFFFDLSDLSNITYKHTAEIPGYSHSLVQFGNGYLIGIGYDEDRNGKVEVYKETETSVEPVCSRVFEGAFPSDYKSVFIDRERNRIGFGSGEKYILLEFDGEELNVILDTVFGRRDVGSIRAFFDGEYLYLFGRDRFKVCVLHDYASGEEDSEYGNFPPIDTTLEFWIGQNVAEVDFFKYQKVPHMQTKSTIVVLGSQYSLQKDEYGFSILPEHHVYYTVENGRIVKINISDPTVTLFGLTRQSGSDEIKETLIKAGFSVGVIGGGDTVVGRLDLKDQRYWVYFTEREARMTVEELKK
ncbi:MAG: hypothetical protein E7599_05290 [Ruminococcaceae bacterium]|nr:hypothetical protein [Oscillospiraceae bacterium]